MRMGASSLPRPCHRPPWSTMSWEWGLPHCQGHVIALHGLPCHENGGFLTAKAMSSPSMLYHVMRMGASSLPRPCHRPPCSTMSWEWGLPHCQGHVIALHALPCHEDGGFLTAEAMSSSSCPTMSWEWGLPHCQGHVIALHALSSPSHRPNTSEVLGELYHPMKISPRGGQLGSPTRCEAGGGGCLVWFRRECVVYIDDPLLLSPLRWKVRYY